MIQQRDSQSSLTLRVTVVVLLIRFHINEARLFSWPNSFSLCKITCNCFKPSAYKKGGCLSVKLWLKVSDKKMHCLFIETRIIWTKSTHMFCHVNLGLNLFLCVNKSVTRCTSETRLSYKVGCIIMSSITFTSRQTDSLSHAQTAVEQ